MLSRHDGHHVGLLKSTLMETEYPTRLLEERYVVRAAAVRRSPRLASPPAGGQAVVMAPWAGTVRDVLDVGSSDGSALQMLWDAGYVASGIDADAGAIEAARRTRTPHL